MSFILCMEHKTSNSTEQVKLGVFPSKEKAQNMIDQIQGLLKSKLTIKEESNDSD